MGDKLIAIYFSDYKRVNGAAQQRVYYEYLLPVRNRTIIKTNFIRKNNLSFHSSTHSAGPFTNLRSKKKTTQYKQPVTFPQESAPDDKSAQSIYFTYEQIKWLHHARSRTSYQSFELLQHAIECRNVSRHLPAFRFSATHCAHVPEIWRIHNNIGILERSPISQSSTFSQCPPIWPDGRDISVSIVLLQ